MGLLWLRRPHEFGSPSGEHKKRFQQEASESSAMVALLWLRWLCMLLSVYGSHFSTRAELRDALLQRLGCEPVPLANSFASMTSQSFRLMRRPQMFGGTKRPNVRVARCFFCTEDPSCMMSHGACLEDQRSEVESVMCETLRKYSHEVERP